MFYANLIDEKLTLDDILKYQPEMEKYIRSCPIKMFNPPEAISRKIKSICDPDSPALEWVGAGFSRLMGIRPGNNGIKGMANHMRERVRGELTVDISDLREHAVINYPYTAESDQVKWLWEILESFDNPSRLKFLKFTTGLSSLPFGGASALPRPFTIDRSSDDATHFPHARTCFLTLYIPEYPTKEQFEEKLIRAMFENSSTGFI